MLPTLNIPAMPLFKKATKTACNFRTFSQYIPGMVFCFLVFIQSRYSTWAHPVAMSIIDLGVEYAKAYIDGTITSRNDADALAAMMNEKVPGAVVSTYTDANGTTFDNYYTVLLAPVDFNDYLD